ncbi:MAG TPA: polymer-forming cytoskeletal protein [Candidatus Angelobacter sp.]
MTSAWAVLMLTSITGGILALPLAPAVLELLRRKDADPLATRKDDGNIHNFAAAFRRYIASAQPTLEYCAERQSLREVRLRDGQWGLVVGASGHCSEIDPNFPNLALFAGAVWLRDDQQFAKDVYAADVLHSGKRNVFRALLGESDIFLDEQTQVLRWIHAEGNMTAAADSSLFGRLSAGKSICLSAGCRFERVHAPVIFAGPDTQNSFSLRQAVPTHEAQKSPGRLGRSRIDGDLHLRVGEMFMGNIVATGSIEVEEDTQIVGSAKAHGDIQLHDGAEVRGAVVAAGSVRIGSNCYIKGPLMAEHQVRVGTGTRIGSLNSPTTLSAPRIHLAGGCVIHGTVWARVEGRVET